MRFSKSWHTHGARFLGLWISLAVFVGSVLPAHAAPALGVDELRAYAQQVQPLHQQIMVIAARDAEIFKHAQAGDLSVLCDGRLAADGAEIARLRQQIAAIPAPAEASALHARVLKGLDQYGKGIKAIKRYCATHKDKFLVKGAAAVLAARLAYGAALVEYNLLVLKAGLEEFMAAYPGSTFEALVIYGQAVGPGYYDWAELIAAEGPFIEAAFNGRSDELCSIDLAGDIADMQAIRDEFAAVTVPGAASAAHQTLARGAEEWQLALEYSAQYCAADSAFEQAVYLTLAKAEFGLATLDFANALIQYTTALEAAWKALWE